MVQLLLGFLEDLNWITRLAWNQPNCSESTIMWGRPGWSMLGYHRENTWGNIETEMTRHPQLLQLLTHLPPAPMQGQLYKTPSWNCPPIFPQILEIVKDNMIVVINIEFWGNMCSDRQLIHPLNPQLTMSPCCSLRIRFFLVGWVSCYALRGHVLAEFELSLIHSWSCEF